MILIIFLGLFYLDRHSAKTLGVDYGILVVILRELW